jgi:hypothetical protein
MTLAAGRRALRRFRQARLLDRLEMRGVPARLRAGGTL